MFVTRWDILSSVSVSTELENSRAVLMNSRESKGTVSSPEKYEEALPVNLQNFGGGMRETESPVYLVIRVQR